MGTTSYPNLESFEIVQTGNTSITIPAVVSSGQGTVNVYVNHNLGYAPVILAYVSDGNSYSPMPYCPSYGNNTSDISLIAQLTCSSLSSYLVFSAIFGVSGTAPSTSGTWPIKYYLLRERAS